MSVSYTYSECDEFTVEVWCVGESVTIDDNIDTGAITEDVGLGRGDGRWCSGRLMTISQHPSSITDTSTSYNGTNPLISERLSLKR